MLDTLDKFETFREGVVMLRLHPDEAPIIREYAMPLGRMRSRSSRRVISSSLRARC